jgi:hypothetical protein
MEISGALGVCCGGMKLFHGRQILSTDWRAGREIFTLKN